MKTCPMLWHRPTAEPGNLLQKNSDLTQTSANAYASGRGSGKGQECLGAECRFHTDDGQCKLELTHSAIESLEQRLADSDERWENVLLTLVELTERINSTVEQQEAEPAARAADVEPTPAPAAPPEVKDERSRALDANLEKAREENAAGIDRYHDNDFVEARNCFRRALKLVPDFVEAHNNLGLIETELGNIEEATAHFRQAIVLAPDLSASYTNLGYVFYLQESYIEAVAMYEEALQRADDSSTAWTNLGNAHFKLGNFGKARHAWEKAVELDPSNERAITNLEQMAKENPV